MYYVGLMSGTSADAIDAVVIDAASSPKLIASHHMSLPDDIRAEIHELTLPATNELQRAGNLGIRLGRLFGQAALTVIEKCQLPRSKIRAIGSHGQTIRHHPFGLDPFTIQIGEPSVIAEETGITTVAHFRNRDLAAGGQGAPLVPAFHRAAFRSNAASRSIVNIGGIANVTYLPKNETQPVIGFDIGPGNTLLDQWINHHLKKAFDDDGQWARSGNFDTKLLTKMTGDVYFSQPPPKSTGREYFNLKWLKNHLDDTTLRPADIQASLLNLTALTVCNALRQHIPTSDEIYICGGGAKNSALLELLTHNLAPLPVRTTEFLGFPPQWVEAAAFAWMAHEALEGRPSNLPSVTGAKHPAILGAIYPA